MEEEIKRLKREKDAVILAHNYQVPEVQDIADFIGDSLELARKATEVRARRIIFCGVYFMAETAAILNPEKEVYIPDPEARCPMAAMLDTETLREAQDAHPDALTVLYVNTRAIAKSFADATCTSANAADVVCSAPSRKVIFGPDVNLGYYIKKRCSDKEITVVPEDGHCYVHSNFTREEVEKARKEHPKAVLIAHPECPPDVQEMADHIASTGGMVRLAGQLDADEFLIATEKEMCYRLSTLYPHKKFHPVRNAICKQMKKITLEKVLNSLHNDVYLVRVPERVAVRARKAIERMLNGW